MLTVAEALNHLMSTIIPLDPRSIPLDEAFGLTLAADVKSTTDSPPFDKSLMDGFAVRSTDVSSGTAALHVVEIVTAGQVPVRSVGPGEAIQIMTGAPLPEGADLVVKIEECRRSSDSVQITTQSIRPGTNLMRRGASIRTGDVVLRAGMTLNGSRIGVLAELGRARVDVHRRPTVAVLATGDELVPVAEQPGPGQIRNSNEAMLIAQVQSAGATPVPLGIARDNREDLRSKIEQGLSSDILVLSGGVSAGTLDLVPSELAAAGVREVFHGVEMKPGKPLWFGERTPCGLSKSANFVFGLPGNPVSSMVCFELFVRTALRRLMGETTVVPQSTWARLEHEYTAKADRPTYHPAHLTRSPDGVAVTLIPWYGSSDLCGTAAANGMALLPGIARQYRVGDILETFAW